MADTTKTTGNVAVSDIDPGGTRPAKGTRTKDTPSDQKVVSGDRNDHTHSTVGPTKPKPE